MSNCKLLQRRHFSSFASLLSPSKIFSTQQKDTSTLTSFSSIVEDMKKHKKPQPIQINQLLVKQANLCTDARRLLFGTVSKNTPNLRSFTTKEKLHVKIIGVLKSSELSEDDKNFIFDLCKKNMQEFYDQSSTPKEQRDEVHGYVWHRWEDKERKEEIFASWMRYYLINVDEENQQQQQDHQSSQSKNVQNKRVGFAAFRFDMDERRPVLYAYELQLVPQYVGKGIGSEVMKIMEECAKGHHMSHLVLTALKNNPSSISFYEKNGYVADSTCPSKDISVPEEAKQKISFKILSKKL